MQKRQINRAKASYHLRVLTAIHIATHTYVTKQLTTSLQVSRSPVINGGLLTIDATRKSKEYRIHYGCQYTIAYLKDKKKLQTAVQKKLDTDMVERSKYVWLSVGQRHHSPPAEYFDILL